MRAKRPWANRIDYLLPHLLLIILGWLDTILKNVGYRTEKGRVHYHSARLDNLNDEELYMEAQADASIASESSSVRISDFTLTSFAEEISY
jgi:hypothetical protein